MTLLPAVVDAFHARAKVAIDAVRTIFHLHRIKPRCAVRSRYT